MSDDKKITDEGKPDPPLEEGIHDDLPPSGSVKETNKVLILTIILLLLLAALFVFAVMTSKPEESEKNESTPVETGQVIHPSMQMV